MEEGTDVMMTLHGDEVRVITLRASQLRVREEIMKLPGARGYTVDDFIAERPALWGERADDA